VIRADVVSFIKTLKYRLADFINPDFGLLDHLLHLNFLTPREVADVRSERTVYRRNDALLELLTSEDKCDHFLQALQRTGQQHVVNYLTQNGGQRHIDGVTYQSIVARNDNRSKSRSERGTRDNVGAEGTKKD